MIREEKTEVGLNVFCFLGRKNDEKIKNILWGIEEEGIPYILNFFEERDACKLGYEAAKESKLQVGIGIGDKEIVLYHEKLDFEKPLFRYSIEIKEEILRGVGTNGARLIKGNPFVII